MTDETNPVQYEQFESLNGVRRTLVEKNKPGLSQSKGINPEAEIGFASAARSSLSL